MIPSALVNGTRPPAVEPFYISREIAIQNEGPHDKIYSLDISILEKTGWDYPESIWIRGDVLTEVTIEGVPGTPVDNPFHVVRVLPQAFPVPLKVLALAKIDVLMTAGLWLERITPNTSDPNVSGRPTTPAYGYDQVREDESVLSDESFGTGWDTEKHSGYFPAQTVMIGLLERPNLVDIASPGVVEYEEAQLVTDITAPWFKNLDLMVLPDGRRGTISRQRTTVQINGVNIARIYDLSIHVQGQGTVIYSVPVT